MGLWIRSQDRTTLIRSYEIYIAEYGKDSYVIRAKRTSHILGAYKTIERALEVLDEIQRTIAKNQSLISLMHNFTDLKGNEEGVAQIFKDMIYEMPLE